MDKYVFSSCHSHRHTPPLHQPHHPASPSHTECLEGSSKLVVQGYSLGQSWQRWVDLTTVSPVVYYVLEFTQVRGCPDGTPVEFTSFSQTIWHFFLNHSRLYSPLHFIISAVTLSTPCIFTIVQFLDYTAADISTFTIVLVLWTPTNPIILTFVLFHLWPFIYSSLSFFHLSIFFPASVSNVPFFSFTFLIFFHASFLIFFHASFLHFLTSFPNNFQLSGKFSFIFSSVPRSYFSSPLSQTFWQTSCFFRLITVWQFHQIFFSFLFHQSPSNLTP